MSAATAQVPVRELEVALLRVDGETQSRASLCEETVEAYSQLMSEGVVFPPVRVWFDGESYWLADGFHRLEAQKRARIPRIRASIHYGSLEDARWDSLGANSTHGLRRSAQDIELIVAKALGHRNATGISVNQLAKHLGIPEPTLRRWIKRVTSSRDEQPKVHLAESHEASTTVMSVTGGRSARGLRNEHRLLVGLDKMRAVLKDRDGQAVLNALEKWFCGLSDADQTVVVLARILSHRKSTSKI